MDYEVEWSPEASEDVEDIAAYIHKDSPIYASKVVEEILAASQRLTQFPLRGRKVPELQATHRECFVYSYRLIYRNERTKRTHRRRHSRQAPTRIH